MKKIQLLVAIIFYAKIFMAQCPIPIELSKAYADDVKKMAHYCTMRSSSPEKNEIAIPITKQNEIMNALAAVFNARNIIPDADSVFNHYCIHADFNYFYTDGNFTLTNRENLYLDRIYVKIDTQVVWTQNWLQGKTTTGYLDLDNFLKDYNYKVEFPFSILPSAARITFDKFINPYAMSKKLAGYNGVIFAEPISLIGDGNFISYLDFGANKQLIFSIGMGDCLSGCTERMSWSFNITSDCNVSLIKKEISATSGSISSMLINCNKFSSNQDIQFLPIIKIFPNPSTNLINIETANELKISQIVIKNTLGIILYSKPYSANIDISNLPEGILILQCYDEQKRNIATQKILHQSK